MEARPGDRDITAKELRNIVNAMDEPDFHKLLSDYVDEISDPKGREEYEEYLKQQEERKDLPPGTKLIRPRAGFCLKTNAKKLVSRQSAEFFDQKVFVNICGAQEVQQPRFEATTQSNGQKGQNVSLPYHFSQGRPDRDSGNQLCYTYDCVFHPRVIDLCEAPHNFQLKKFVCDTAVAGLKQLLAKHKEKVSSDYKIMVNMRCKGGKPATLSIKDEGTGGSFDMDPLKHKTKLQKDITNTQEKYKEENPEQFPAQDEVDVDDVVPTNEPLLMERKSRQQKKIDAQQPVEGEVVEPTYKIVEKYGVDLSQYFGQQDAFPGKDSPAILANAGKRPQELVITIYLPTIRSMKKADLQINEKEIHFSFPKKFLLKRPLPYPVNHDKGSAKFDKTLEYLQVTVPVLPNKDQPKQDATKVVQQVPEKVEEIAPKIEDAEIQAVKDEEYEQKVQELKGDIKIMPSELKQEKQPDHPLVQEVEVEEAVKEQKVKEEVQGPQLNWEESPRVVGEYNFAQAGDFVFIMMNLKNYKKEEVRYVITEDELFLEVWDGNSVRKVCVQLFDLVEPEHSIVECFKSYISVKMQKANKKQWDQIGINVTQLKDMKNRRMLSNYLESVGEKPEVKKEEEKPQVQEDEQEDEAEVEASETKSQSVAQLEEKLHREKAELPKPSLIPLSSDLILQIT